MLLNRFLENIFDYPTDNEFASGFVENGEVSEPKILQHHLTKHAVFFSVVWKYIYGTYNPSNTFHYYVTKENIDVFKAPIDTQLVDKYLNAMLLFKLGLVTRVNLLELGKFAMEVIGKLGDAAYMKRMVLEKLQFRLQTQLSYNNNLMFSYYTAVTNNKQLLATNTPETCINPFTNFTVHCDSTLPGNVRENNAYIMYSDMYFMLKLLMHPVVIITKTFSEENMAEITTALTHLNKCFDKKCVVISPSNMHASILSKCDVYAYHYEEQLMDYLPKISPWCLCIADAHDTSFKHGMVGVAKDPKHNVFWHLGKLSVSAVASFDRVLMTSSCGKDAYALYNTMDFWKTHTKFSCPRVSPMFAQNNTLLYIDFMYKYYEKHKADIESCMTAMRRQRGKNVILLVDNRKNDMSVLSLKFAIRNTYAAGEDQWDVYILTSKNAKEFYQKHIPFAHVKTHPLLETNFNIDVYNDIMEDIDMWKELQAHSYEYALVIQDDGVLFRKGVDKFMKYDYVGAPWGDIPDNEGIKRDITTNMVGNGGLSLRKIAKMIEICQRYGACKHELFYHNINRIPEDIYFVKWLTKDGASFPTIQEACHFSIEQILNQNTIGFHKFWVYNPYPQVKFLFEHFLSVEGI